MYTTTQSKSIWNRFKHHILPFLALLFLLLLIALVFWWDNEGREQFFYTDVIVLIEDVPRGTIVTKEMMGIMKVEETKAIENVVRDADLINGMAAVHFIPRLSQLDPRYFEEAALVTDHTRMITKIHNTWIYALPNSLRRKDKIEILEVPLDIVDQSQSTSVKREDTRAIPEDGEPENLSFHVYEEHEQLELERNVSRPLLHSTVAYVKDNANREVITVSEEERFDGSSTISEIELVLSLDELNVLEEAISRGSKLLIRYTEGAIDYETRSTQ